MVTPIPPKLLLDANVFRDLADGALPQYQHRLLRVAAFRSPPLLWICPITFDEIISHIRAEEAHRFEHFRDSLRWVDRLCGNAGLAEDLPWILRRGVFAGPGAPYDNQKLSATLNQVRRDLIKVERFANVPAQIVDVVPKIRKDALQRINKWAAHWREPHAKVGVEPSPGEPRLEGKALVSSIVLEISRKHAAGSPGRLEWVRLGGPDDAKLALVVVGDRQLCRFGCIQFLHLLRSGEAAGDKHGHQADHHASRNRDGSLGVAKMQGVPSEARDHDDDCEAEVLTSTKLTDLFHVRLPAGDGIGFLELAAMHTLVFHVPNDPLRGPGKDLLVLLEELRRRKRPRVLTTLDGRPCCDHRRRGRRPGLRQYGCRRQGLPKLPRDLLFREPGDLSIAAATHARAQSLVRDRARCDEDPNAVPR
jgi:hypothetical protein